MPTNSTRERVSFASATAAGARQRHGSVVPYDFRRPSKLSREHIRVLQMAYDTFAKRLTTLLTSSLRQVCQVSITEISQQSYEEYVGALEAQTLLVPLSVPPLAGTGVIEFSLPLALTAIDHMLGGPGGEQAPRTLTDIEITLIQSMLDQTTSTLRYALEPIVAVTPSLGAIEYNPQFVQAAAGTDAVVVGDFELIIGDQQGRLSLCLPLVPLVPRLMAQRPRAEGDGADARAAEATARRLRDRLGDVPLDVSIRFSPLVLSPARILTLAEGDLVTLDHRAGAALTVQAGGISFGSAVAGRSGNRLAALIVDTAHGVDGTSTSTPSTREHA